VRRYKYLKRPLIHLDQIDISLALETYTYNPDANMASSWREISGGVMGHALRSPALLSAAIFLVIAAFVRYLITRSKRLNLPIVDLPGAKLDREKMIEASAKVSCTMQN
jgi:hypothetical protein